MIIPIQNPLNETISEKSSIISQITIRFHRYFRENVNKVDFLTKKVNFFTNHDPLTQSIRNSCSPAALWDYIR